MWIDATVAASFVTNPNDSTVADSVGFALAPDNGLGKRSATGSGPGRSAIPAGTANEDAAKQFIEWATSKEYIELVAPKEGWANVPPGARTSLYENPKYQDVPFAKMTLESINCRPIRPTRPSNPAPTLASSSRPSPSLRVSRPRSARSSRQSMPDSRSVDEALSQGSGDHQRRNGSRRLPLSFPPRTGGRQSLSPSGSRKLTFSVISQ